MKKENDDLTFVKKVSDGFLFINYWKTGWQQLIFKTIADAKLWASKNNATYTDWTKNECK